MTLAERSKLFRQRNGALAYRKRALRDGRPEVSAAANPFYGLVAYATAPKYITERAREKNHVETRGRPRKVREDDTDTQG